MNSPTEFWVMYTDEVQKFREIQTSLARYGRVCTAMSRTTIVPGAFCMTAKDGIFYRGRIDYICNTSVLVSASGHPFQSYTSALN